MKYDPEKQDNRKTIDRKLMKPKKATEATELVKAPIDAAAAPEAYNIDEYHRGTPGLWHGGGEPLSLPNNAVADPRYRYRSSYRSGFPGKFTEYIWQESLGVIKRELSAFCWSCFVPFGDQHPFEEYLCIDVRDRRRRGQRVGDAGGLSVLSTNSVVVLDGWGHPDVPPPLKNGGRVGRDEFNEFVSNYFENSSPVILADFRFVEMTAREVPPFTPSTDHWLPLPPGAVADEKYRSNWQEDSEFTLYSWQKGKGCGKLEVAAFRWECIRSEEGRFEPFIDLQLALDLHRFKPRRRNGICVEGSLIGYIQSDRDRGVVIAGWGHPDVSGSDDRVGFCYGTFSADCTRATFDRFLDEYIQQFGITVLADFRDAKLTRKKRTRTKR